MRFLTPILNQQQILSIRRNHAVEHATINILSKQFPARSISGYSNAGGFWLMGRLPAESIRQAVDEAVARLKAGEPQLAFHPNCGTNYAVMGSAAGLAAWLGMLGAGKKWNDKLDRLPGVMMLATLALIFSQPFAYTIQAKVTTSPLIGGEYAALRIEDVSRGEIQAYRVHTKAA